MTDDGEDSTSQSLSPESVDDERPPSKKARYVWQIKGQYELKQPPGTTCPTQCGESSPPVTTENPDSPKNRWQTRQMAKAVVDNTINKVLEGMGFMPLPNDAEDLFEDVMFNPPVVAGNVEDEAVLMAIQHHGLQNPCSCSATRQHQLLTRQLFHRRPSPKINPDPGPSDEHDFLAQAVAVAIQKKGLGNVSQDEHG